MAVKVKVRLSSRLKGYTTRQLEEHMNERRWNQEKVSLWENSDGLFWQGKQVPLRRFSMYLAHDDPWRRVRFRGSAEDEEDERNPAAKQVWLPYGCIYRGPVTGGGWVSNGLPRYVTLCDTAAWVELLNLDEEQASLERYELTADPMEEDVSAQEFEYVRHLGVLTITGVRHYCERLHIPAQLDGMPVVNVFLSSGLYAPYLRELTIEEGICKLDFSFSSPELKEIHIPDSVCLVRPPDGIRHTAWFQDRPDGPVYFQGYYCGTKGIPEADQLTIREGTIGVIRWADERISWKKIQLPASLAYISHAAFNPCGNLEEVVRTKEAIQLKAHFYTRYPFLINAIRKQHRSGGFEQLPEVLTGKLLYELGRSSMVVRQQIPREWLPSAPRLRYDQGWIVEFWYCAEFGRGPGWYAAFHLPSGEPVEVKKLDGHAWLPLSSSWTDAYLPPDYLLAEEYLDCCAMAIRGGEPTAAILEQLNAWWESLVPRKVLTLMKKNHEWEYEED